MMILMFIQVEEVINRKFENAVKDGRVVDVE